ncbi:MAG: caspase family protein [Inhella sp.]
MRTFLLSLLLWALAAWPAAATSLDKGKRIALVIGNAAYKSSPLANPLNDARAVSDSLRRLGFKVISLENASQKQMFDATREFGDQLKDGVGLFYYAGHGVQVKGRNFLVPVDAHIEREDEVAYKAFDIGQVLEKMESAKNPLNIVILDACRNNPFTRGARSGASGLAQMDAPTGSIIAFATAPGAEAADGAGNNGLYTSHLLRNMNTPGLKVEDVFKRTRVAVRQASNGRQIPWESTSLEGDFFFTGNAGASTASAALPADLDQEMWQLVAESGKPSAYRAYLERFPNGRYAEQARVQAAQPVAAAAPSGTGVAATAALGRQNVARSTGGFSFSEEEAKMDRATAAGREVAFERTLASLECSPARRQARVQLKLSESGGGQFSVALAQRLRQAGMKVGQGGGYVVQGTVSSTANRHHLLRVNEVSVNAALSLISASGQEVASAMGREESYAGADVSNAFLELVQAQATDMASQLITQLCRPS